MVTLYFILQSQSSDHLILHNKQHHSRSTAFNWMITLESFIHRLKSYSHLVRQHNRQYRKERSVISFFLNLTLADLIHRLKSLIGPLCATEEYTPQRLSHKWLHFGISSSTDWKVRARHISLQGFTIDLAGSSDGINGKYWGLSCNWLLEPWSHFTATEHVSNILGTHGARSLSAYCRCIFDWIRTLSSEPVYRLWCEWA